MDAQARPLPGCESAGARAERWQDVAAERPSVVPAFDASPAARSYQPLVTAAIALAAGIIADRYLASSPGFVAWAILAAGALVVWAMAWRRHRDGFAAWPLLVALAMAGGAWHHLQWHLFNDRELARFAGSVPEPACLEVVAREVPDRIAAPRPTPLRAIPGSERSRFMVEVLRIRDGTHWLPASGVCQASVEGHLLGVQAGDRLRIFGQLSRPSPPLNPGEFDFAAHARIDRQLTRVSSSVPESVHVIHAASGYRLQNLLERVRQGGRRIVRDYVDPQRAGIASAILLGSRAGLPSEETSSFLVTGTIHILVVSGLHVSILASGLYLIMRIGWLSRRKSLAFIMLVVTCYALVAEAQPPVLRAAVLTAVVCIAALTGRQAIAFNSLAAAAIIVLAINPAELFSAGTQLSFLAVATLIWIHPLATARRDDPLDTLLAAARPWPLRLAMRLARRTGWLLAASAAIWLVALPLVLYRFHVVTPVALLLSPAIWVLSAAILWSGFLAIGFAWLIPPVGAGFGSACDASLAALHGVVRWAESLPGGHFWAAGPALWWVIGFYAGLLGIMLHGRALGPTRWKGAALAVWILIGLAPPLERGWTRDSFDCTFVAVGHGASVLLQAPTGETLLYDAGALGSPEYATQSIASSLWHRGLMRIDAVVISHADVDHYNALPGLLQRFRVGAVYVSPMMFDGFEDGGATRGPAVLREAIVAAGVPIREIWSGDRLRVGPAVTIEVLHPPRRGVVGSDNANSLVLAVEYGGCRILLPGDLESPGLEAVTAELPYDCDVLLAPHHGSRRSDPPGFAAWSTPEWVIISGGGDQDVRSVTETYTRAGARVLSTSERGAIEFSLTNGAVPRAHWHRFAE